MCKTYIAKTLKNKKRKTYFRVYDTGTPKLITLQGRFRRYIKEYFRIQLAIRDKFIDDEVPELNVNISKIVNKKILVYKTTIDKNREEKMLRATNNILNLGMKEGVEQFKSTANTNNQFKVAFGISNDNIKERASTRAGDLITGLNNTTRKRVMFTIQQAIEDGDSVDQLKKKLRNNFGFSSYRAGLISTTEL